VRHPAACGVRRMPIGAITPQARYVTGYGVDRRRDFSPTCERLLAHRRRRGCRGVFAAPRQLSMPADFGPHPRVTDRAGGPSPVSLTLWRRRLQFRGQAVVRERIGEGLRRPAPGSSARNPCRADRERARPRRRLNGRDECGRRRPPGARWETANRRPGHALASRPKVRVPTSLIVIRRISVIATFGTVPAYSARAGPV
jgi:hypothetical protein